MRYVEIAVGCLLAGLSAMSGHAAGCANNAHAIGTSRILAVDPVEHARVGSMQYEETLPLAEKEVVLTFDDGPLPAYTDAVLETLAAECVKATFFMVGSMARAYPETVRRVYNAGHTVGSHSFTHPRFFATVPHEKAVADIDEGITVVGEALGDTRALAPFFRFPGFGRTADAEAHLARRGVMTWSVDAHGEDWMKLSPEQVVQRLMRRLDRKGKGVLMLHDIQPVAVLALPRLLVELKARGYRIVHVVPAGGDRPKTVTEPEAWAVLSKEKASWPVVARKATAPPALPAPSAMSFGFPELFSEALRVRGADHGPAEEFRRQSAAELFKQGRRRDAPVIWADPDSVRVGDSAALPAPSAQTFVAVASVIAEPKRPWVGAHSTERQRLAVKPARARIAQAAIASPGLAEGRIDGPSEQPRPPGLVAMRDPGSQADRKASQETPSPAWARRLNWFH